MEKIIFRLMGVVLVIGAGWWGWYKFWPMESPLGIGGEVVVKGIDYDKYSFDSLKENYLDSRSTHLADGFKKQDLGIEIGEDIEEVETRRKYLGYEVDFDTKVFWFKSRNKKISGMINYWPWKSSLSPVVIMVRGYAEKEGYYPGFGTWRVADQLAKAGFMTVSIDFLGFGQSDGESSDMLEARFEKVENVLDLLRSVESLPYVDKNNINFWAHSNGGQIVLSVLEITGSNYPTVLWAPMTDPFPQSVLSTIEEDSPVRGEIEKFVKYFDARKYAFENYYSWIDAPVLIIQGDKDPWCKTEWQEKVVGELKKLGKRADLIVLKGADHNMAGRWEEGVEKSLDFYAKILGL